MDHAHRTSTITRAGTALKSLSAIDLGKRAVAELIQRISAVVLFFLIPVKIYTGWAARGKVPDLPDFLGASAKDVHYRMAAISSTIDILLLLFFLLHGFYGLRVILIDLGVIREEKFFWRTLGTAAGIFGVTVWFVYFHGD